MAPLLYCWGLLFLVMCKYINYFIEMSNLKQENRVRESTSVRYNLVHDLHDEILKELRSMGSIGNYVAKDYIYMRIREKTGLSLRRISYILNHTKRA